MGTKRTPKQKQPSSAEHVLSTIAVHGVVTRKSAIAAGISDRVINRRVNTGFLIDVAQGVYLLPGATLSGDTAVHAALAATGSRGMGLWSAASEHGVTGGVTPSAVHVMVDRRRKPPTTGWYITHPTRRLNDEELTTRNGRPVSTLPRTIRDLAACLPYRDWADKQIDSVVEEAIQLNRLRLAQLERAFERETAPQLRKRLHDLLARHTGEPPEVFKSIGETWLKDLVVRRGLPMPLFNVRPDPNSTKEVDAFFPLTPLIVEFDGFAHHRTRSKHDADRRRDRRSWRNGVPVIRITKTDYEEDLPALEDDLVYMVLTPPVHPMVRLPTGLIAPAPLTTARPGGWPAESSGGM
jgi:predicted transcriptional regulator of viral defense system/very-short-patch-repair endonuclease